MVIAASVIELHIHGCCSLKEKRGVLRSIRRRLRNRFNLGVAEVDAQDKWQIAVLGLAAVGSDAVSLRRVLDQAADFVESMHLAELRSADIEVVELPLHEAAAWPDGVEGEY